MHSVSFSLSLTISSFFSCCGENTVTTANTERDKVGAAFMQFKFVLNKGNGTQENIHVEMTLPQFYEFVHQMEQAKTHLDFFA